MKKLVWIAAVVLLLAPCVAIPAQDLALGQKIDMSLFTRTNEKLNDPNQAHFRMIAPQNNGFLDSGWDEISVNALSDGTIQVIRYLKKGLPEDTWRGYLATFFILYLPDSEYTEEKNIKLGDTTIPRFLKPGTNEGVICLPGGRDIDIVFSREAGNFERDLAQVIEDLDSRFSSSSTPSTPHPSTPPRQAEGSMSAADAPPSSGSSKPSSPSRSSGSFVDAGFTAHLNLYGQGWYQNLFSFGIPLQLGVEIELPFVTLDLLGEGSAGMGYGNLFEYHLGGMAELYFFDKKIGLGGGGGLYGNAVNLGVLADSSGESSIRYAPPVKTSYYRFALIFRGTYKTSLYAELYGDGKWGFGVMFGTVLTDR
jgi:hypothetical protein